MVYFHQNAIDISTIENNDKQINDYAFSSLQNAGVPILIDFNNTKHLDEKSIIIQYAVLFDFLSLNLNLKDNSNNENNNTENYYKANYLYAEIGQPNFNNGIILEKDLPRFITSSNQIVQKINEHFKIKMRSRYPIQIAYIVKDGDELIVKFNIQEFEQVLKRAGSRPILFLAGSGRFQQGKTLVNSGITGNLGYIIGNGYKETTKGVYIDGPYSIDYLYQRFNIDMRKDIYYGGNEILSPLVYFFDIKEGYDGIMHGNDIQKNNDAYIKMCTPFLCLSSIFILLSEPNANVQEIKSFFERVKVSKLTTYSNSEDSNGALHLNIVFNKYNNILYDFGDYNQKNIKDLIHKFQIRMQNDWIGINNLNKYGIRYKFLPILQGIKPYFDDGSFFDVFRYFVKSIVRSIESAAEGKFVRSAEQSISLFNYIIEHLNDPLLGEKVQLLMKSVNENSFEAFSNMACKQIENIINPMIDNEFKKYHDNFNFTINIDEIKNKYISICETKIQNELNVIKDHEKVSYNIEKIKFLTQTKIDEKYDELIKYKKELFDKSNSKIEQKADQLVSEILNQLYCEFAEEKNFNFDQAKIQNHINKKIENLRNDLYNYKNDENLFLLKNQKIDSIIAEKENVLNTMIDIHINNEKANANQLKEEMDMNLTIIKSYKETMITEYNCRENHEMIKLKGDLQKDSFYIENYKQIFEVHQKCQNSISNYLLSKKHIIIDDICKDLSQNDEKNSEIIERMKQKNTLIINDNILFNIINENKNELISKINLEFDRAKFNLCKIQTVPRRTGVSWNKVKVEIQTITYYPDGTVTESDWVTLRTETKQFADLKTDILDACNTVYTYIVRKFNKTNTVHNNES